MFGKLFRILKPATIHKRKRRKEFQLQLEYLEDRTVPTGLAVTDLTAGVTAQNLVTKIVGPGVVVSGGSIQLTAHTGNPAFDIK